MEKQLDQLTALVTGGTRGIGFAIAKAFVERGAHVAVNGRDQATGEAAAASLGEAAIFLQADMTVRDDIEKMIDTFVAHFGGLDILVNNAGGASDFSPVAAMQDQVWDACLELNLTATFVACRCALKTMIPAGSGRIINISSMEGKQGTAGLANYVAAKHGLNGFTKALAKEVGSSGITVNAICPGVVMTDMTEQQGAKAAAAMNLTKQEMIDLFASDTAIGRVTEAEEVAAMAVLLASDQGAGITGSQISIDGGSSSY